MTRAEAKDKLVAILQEHFKNAPAEITEELNFKEDLGADSIAMMEVILEMEDAFDIEVADDEVANIQTVGEALDYLEKL